jgi:hypothetical protein
LIRAVDQNVANRAVTASRGKVARAEPIAALYEQGRVFHLGAFPHLEDQMTAFTSSFDRKTAGFSPGRVDALVWCMSDLMLAPMKGFGILAAITAKKAGFKSLGDTWADTTTSHGRLMLTVLGGLVEFERDLIRARTGEGRARAVARGQRMGRPPKLTPHQKREAIKRRDQGDESLADIGRSYNVSAATISRAHGPAVRVYPGQFRCPHHLPDYARRQR